MLNKGKLKCNSHTQHSYLIQSQEVLHQVVYLKLITAR